MNSNLNDVWGINRVSLILLAVLRITYFDPKIGYKMLKTRKLYFLMEIIV